MSSHADRDRKTKRDAPDDLRVQLDELLAAFDEIALYGRERRLKQRGHASDQAPQ